MNLILLSLTAGGVSIAIALLYAIVRHLQHLARHLETLDERLNRLEVSLHEQGERQTTLDASVHRFAREVVSRDRLRQSEQSDQRHGSAIRDAREGMTVDDLARQHGISHAEARLIVALHGDRSVTEHRSETV